MILVPDQRLEIGIVENWHKDGFFRHWFRHVADGCEQFAGMSDTAMWLRGYSSGSAAGDYC
jgi:hypothetical protein